MTNSYFTRIPLLGVLLVGGTLSGSGCTADASATNPETENVGSTQITFERFESTVQRESGTGIYIVEGDIPVLTREALKAYFDEYVSQGALIVNRVNGADGRWNDTQKLDLSYCVSTTFGTKYETVVASMAAAASSWSSHVRVSFRHIAGQDRACNETNTKVLFDVSPVTGQPYSARAFFPGDTRKDRRILLNTTAFGKPPPQTLSGTLRHELGHVLGFRHEHTRPEAKDTCFEDNNWRALTPYDSASVMHYTPYDKDCGGTNHGDYNLTARDIEGAVLLYGAPHSVDPHAE
ncbi:hypothetical protein LZC95_17140 [Pendulispora brunnea]|uniref:Peptidase metallopeptidase domain-containing protein n=1 Tax=Pendulispora brunnea TaxID=2905690 RepID=A0ABZ2KLR0_9BACT